MKESSDDGIGIHPQLHQDNGGAHRMDDIGLPGAAKRSLMGALCQEIGFFHLLHIVLLIGLFDPLRKLLIQLVHQFTNFSWNIR